MNCPRPLEYWSAQCPPGAGELTAVQIAAIAQQARFAHGQRFVGMEYVVRPGANHGARRPADDGLAHCLRSPASYNFV